MNFRKLLLRHFLHTIVLLWTDLISAQDITCQNATGHPNSPKRPSEWRTIFKQRPLPAPSRVMDAKYTTIYLSQNLVLVEDLKYLQEMKNMDTKFNYDHHNYKLYHEPAKGFIDAVTHVRLNPSFLKKEETSSKKITKDQFALLHLNKGLAPLSLPCLPFTINLTNKNFTIRTEAEERGGQSLVIAVSLGKEERSPWIDRTASNPTECWQEWMTGTSYNGGSQQCVVLCRNECIEKYIFQGPGVLNKLRNEFRDFAIFREVNYQSGNPEAYVLKYDRLGSEAYGWIQKNKNQRGKFTCTNGNCIDIKFVCNGQNDCADSSDEDVHYCSKLCPEGELPCGIGTCFSEAEHGKNCKIVPLTIILSGAGIAFALVVGGIITMYCRHTKKLKDEIRSLTDTEVEEFLVGINPATEGNDSGAGRIDYLIRSIPWDRKKEIPRKLIKIENEITRGHFGIVSKAKLLDSNAKDIRCEVAVKMPISSIKVTEFKALLDEVKIMSYIGSHENVVRFFGACTDNVRKRDILLVMEYCPNGCVLDYLRNNRNVFYPLWTDIDDTNRQKYANIAKLDKSFNTNTLLKWAIQTASGIEFLTSMKVLHRDIATRNLLLSTQLRIKIADFGLSRKLEPGSDEYTATSGEVPWRWLAPEAFEIPPVYSEKSDIWAFGVAIWEMFSLGESPYNGREWSSTFPQELIHGLRLRKPRHGTDELYALMITLWNLDPQCRPTFTEAKDCILQMLKVFHDDGETAASNLSQEYFQVTD